MSRIVVCPTHALQQMVMRRVRRGLTAYNYAVAFKDANGWGISLAKVEWLAPGQRYIKP